jgi:hypothetical protein
MLVAELLRKGVSWASFVVLRRKWRKQSSVFMTWTWVRLLLPSKARAWKVTSVSMVEDWSGPAKEVLA